MRTFQNKRPARILIVGLGAVGTALARAMSRTAGLEVTLFGRERTQDKRIARELELPLVTRVDLLENQTDIVILAVRDNQIDNTARLLAKCGFFWPRMVVMHTSGALGMEPLRTAARKGAAIAAFHPYQTFPRASKRDVGFSGVTFGITGDERGKRAAFRLARMLGGRPVHVTESDRLLYHASAVLSCGMIAANLDMGVKILRNCGFTDRQARYAVLHIAGETLQNARELGVREAITGPASRGDLETVRKHVAALKKRSRCMAQAYAILSEYIAQMTIITSQRKSR